MNELFSEYTSQLRDQLSSRSSLGRLSHWMETKTSLAGRPFSFSGHEFQKAIVDSTHHNAVIIKPSQCGMTECGARFILSFLAVEADTVSMYIMPTAHEAVRAIKSRFDPIIRTSPYLKSVLHSGSDSASFKQIGSSQLFSTGSFGKAIISIPTDLLSVDERNFCNEEAISTAESRLTHSRFINKDTGARGIKRFWSTPTAVNAGVDGMYQQSNQNRRLVKCKHCRAWFWPTFLNNVVVQGWDRPMAELMYNDASSLDHKGLLATAQLLCESCHKPISVDNLGPDHRSWVAEFPSKTYIEGWHVNPFDLPNHHTPESILRKLIDYRNDYSHFKNFVLGLPHSDASNSIIDDVVVANTKIRPVAPNDAQENGVTGCIMGLDVGKISWAVIGKVDYATDSINVLWVEQIKLEGEEYDDLKVKVLNLMKKFGVCLLVCDSMPFTPSILAIQAAMPKGFVLPNNYSLRDTKLPLYIVNEKEHTISSHRTKVLNLMVKKVNNGEIKWPLLEEMITVRKHLQGSSRIDRLQESGKEESDWIKTGPDHYFHAVNYLSIAHEILSQGFSAGWAPVPTLHEVFVGSKFKEDS